MSRRRCTAVGALAAATAMLGCAAAAPSTCPELRVLFDGQCCSPWSVADLDVCLPTTWTTPTADVALGTGLDSDGAAAPQVAVDGRGRVIVAWTSASGSATSIALAAETSDGEFDVIAPASALTGHGEAASLATDAQGRALLSWHQRQDEQSVVHYAEREPDGTWRLPPEREPLSHGDAATSPHSVYSAYGEALVVYGQWTGAQFGVALARRDAGTSTGPLAPPAQSIEVLSPLELTTAAPRVAVASNGDAVVAWCPLLSSAPRAILAERFGPDGGFFSPPADAAAWLPGAQIEGTTGACPVPAIDDRGAAALAWTQPNLTGDTPVFVGTRSGWGQWTTPAGLDDPLSTPTGVAKGLQVAFGGDGSLHVAWYQDDEGRLSIVSAYRAPDETWSEPVLVSAPGINASHPALAVGDEGEAVVAYVQRQGDSTSATGRWDVVARQRNPGDEAWLDPQLLSGDLTGDARTPTIAWRSATFVVAWVQGAQRQGRVYFARISPQPPALEQ